MNTTRFLCQMPIVLQAREPSAHMFADEARLVGKAEEAVRLAKLEKDNGPLSAGQCW